MKVSATRRITIAGAGLAGSLLAVLLSRRGYAVDVFERNPDPREAGDAAGRSINLALAERGRHALAQAGLLDAVDQYTIPMRGRMLHDIDGALTLQPYGKDESEVIWSVHRARLNRTLLDAADEDPNVTLYFEHRIDDIDWDQRRLQCSGEGESPHAHDFDVLVAADGGGSAVRRSLGQVTDLGVREELLDHGYKELEIPAGPDGDFLLDPHALHIWPRGGFMMIGLPNADRSFTGTLFLANDGEPGFSRLQDWPAQRAFMEQHFPDVLPLMPAVREDFNNNPVGLLGTIRCQKWHYRDRAVLLGDAAHAIVPFHGQGMNAAFEDCVAFVACLDAGDRDWAELFSDFQARRIDNANAIADMALENYGIMREAVRDPRFLLRKSLEHELERQHPERFVARYSLVMFHRISYAEAFRRGEVQSDILDTLLEEANTLDEVNFARAESLVSERLAPLPADD
ncbi:MAG: FAD-dependent monooxygenase [Xanthomonadales bacterium]|nr:FAD-dependent monooxygenase [Xanthomonadales bacterium]